MASIHAVDWVFRFWEPITFPYPTATKKFHAAKTLAASSDQAPVDTQEVTADEFFSYLKRVKQERARTNRNRRSSVDPNGDFDDMGNGGIAAQYHYDQKRRRGRF